MGTMGLPVLVSVIQEDRDDLQLLIGALEVLIATFASEEPPYAGPHAQQEQQQAQQAQQNGGQVGSRAGGPPVWMLLQTVPVAGNAVAGP
jgi:hypothetical protein